MSLIKLPKDTREILGLAESSFRLNQNQSPVNPALLMGKYLAYVTDKSNKKTQKEYIAAEISLSKNQVTTIKPSEKQKTFLELRFGDDNCINKKFKLGESLIVGIGSESVIETNITLHHIYGIPYIPGSAVKGNLRSYIINEFFNFCGDQPDLKNSKNEIEALKDPLFSYIFGSPAKDKEEDGKVYFLDSFSNDYKSKLDIMNPHYGKYYKAEQYPTDTNHPVPLYFIVITEASFNFNIGFETFSLENISSESKFFKYWETNYKGKSFKSFIEDLLVKMLDEKGVGAKTSSGYGFMTPNT